MLVNIGRTLLTRRRVVRPDWLSGGTPPGQTTGLGGNDLVPFPLPSLRLATSRNAGPTCGLDADVTTGRLIRL